MLQSLVQRLQAHQAQALPPRPQQASVLVPITRHEQHPELVLTVRAQHLNTHRGEVCFPGGKQDSGDLSLAATALREAQEEIALPSEQVELVAPLGQLLSKHQLLVTPWVGLIPVEQALSANPDELARIFRVPLAFFLETPVRFEHYALRGLQVTLPAWDYEGEHIWGLTACIIAELLEVGLGLEGVRTQRPEQR
ncbi:CoA pyrophosphatase [Nitrincola tapanii]|uniref:CoA pyrophosphatase n=1 Tax=Nitrincola tapanii TaxID=1708751 RepID=A0A5A9W7I5_9GAMM|nr:CoA pyrophosphatase [Nitrincola tapanii]KAA0876493.1 CoA pyrophosphatase [Nitrincola tapanii]